MQSTTTQPEELTSAFRQAISHFSTGVAVITTRTQAGPAGMTASAVASLSIDPLQLLVCIRTDLPTRAAIEEAGRFAVNVLGDGDEQLARHFATPRPDKFAGVEIRDDYDVPVLDDAIGKMRANKGNFGVLVRAYTYIRTYGPDGLLHVSQSAILNANYLKHALESDYEIAYPQTCQHEFVATAERQKEEHDVTALDIAKRLLDFGMYAPTVYFPLIVHEAMMIEPTETETRETLDYFVSVMRQIAEEAQTNPEIVKTAPHTTPVGRLDQALAARKPNLRWTRGQEGTH